MSFKPAVGDKVWIQSPYGDQFPCEVLKLNEDGSIDVHEPGDREKPFKTITAYHTELQFLWP